MVKHTNLLGLCFITIFCIVILISYNFNNAFNESAHTFHYMSPDDDFILNATRNSLMREVLYRQWLAIEQEIKEYTFPLGSQLRNYTPITGGKPLRNIIVTTWRSGSTFLGDVLNSVPGSYYHYEPLLDYGIVQIRGPPLNKQAVSVLKDLLSCDYTKLREYLDYGMSHEYLFTHNDRLWEKCEPVNLCWEPKFLNNFCKLFPFQTMKVVRLRLKQAEELLMDEYLNVKMVLLVRDPRGTLQSRKHRIWCPGNPDCDNSNLLCADMVADYNAAVQFSSKYPNTFRAVRYEDLSLRPYKTVRQLFEYFGLDFHRNVSVFLDTHTKLNVGGVSSTFRDSRNAPFHWRFDLNISEILHIEQNCDEAMKLWGYNKIDNLVDLRNFNPLRAYAIN